MKKIITSTAKAFPWDMTGLSKRGLRFAVTFEAVLGGFLVFYLRSTKPLSKQAASLQHVLGCGDTVTHTQINPATTRISENEKHWGRTETY